MRGEKLRGYSLGAEFIARYFTGNGYKEALKFDIPSDVKFKYAYFHSEDHKELVMVFEHESFIPLGVNESVPVFDEGLTTKSGDLFGMTPKSLLYASHRIGSLVTYAFPAIDSRFSNKV